jgi:hypothetical protein
VLITAALACTDAASARIGAVSACHRRGNEESILCLTVWKNIFNADLIKLSTLEKCQFQGKFWLTHIGVRAIFVTSLLHLALRKFVSLIVFRESL